MRKARIAIGLAALVLGAAAPDALAAGKAWDGGGGNTQWHTPANWAPDGVPTTNDAVSLGTSTVTITGTDAIAGSVDVAFPGTLTVDGVKLTVTGLGSAAGDPHVGCGCTVKNGGTLRLEGATRLNANPSVTLGDTDGIGSAAGKIEVAGSSQVYETINEAAAGTGLVHVLPGATLTVPFTLTLNTELDNDGAVVLPTSGGSLFLQPRVNQVTTSTGAFTTGDNPAAAFQPQLVLAPAAGVSYVLPPGGVTGPGTVTVQTQTGTNTVRVAPGTPFDVGMLKINGFTTFDLDANGTAKRLETLASTNAGGRAGDGSLAVTGPGASLMRGIRFSGGTTTTFGAATTLTLEAMTVEGGAKVVTAGTTTIPNRLAIVLGTFSPATAGTWENTGTATVVNDLSDGAHLALVAWSLGKVVNAGTFTKDGSEEMSGRGAFENSGTLNVNGGTMGQNDGTVTQTAGTTTIATGATLDYTHALQGGVLRGAGTVRAVTATGGTIRPGTSPGTLTVLGNLAMGAGATLNPELTGTTPGTQFDVLDVKGAAAIGGTLTVDSTGYTPALDTTYRIVPAASQSGSFATVNGAAPGGRKYLAEYTAAGAGAGVRLCAKASAATACGDATPDPDPDPTPVVQNPGGNQPPPAAAQALAPAASTVAPSTTSVVPTPTATPQVADVVVLPSTRRCASRRNFPIRLRVPRGSTVTRATVKVNGKRVAVRQGDRLRSTVNLTKLPKGRFTVTVELRLSNGKTVKDDRRYRTCTPKKKRRT